MSNFIEIGYDCVTNDISSIMLVRMSEIKELTREIELMDKHDDDSYDEEGSRKIKHYIIYFVFNDGETHSEQYDSESLFLARWQLLMDIL